MAKKPLPKKQPTGAAWKQQRKFCEEYLVDLNGAAAAVRAGYSPKTAKNSASRLLAYPYINDYITKKREKVIEKLEISRERILAEYAKIGFADVREMFDDRGALIPVKDLNDNIAGAITSIEVEDGTERNPAVTTKVKLSDKKAALDALFKHLGFAAPDKVEHTGADGQPLEVTHKVIFENYAGKRKGS